ncbi:ABC transporter substrate-binding protein [Methylocystis sp. JR02]|uniref:ABC transporter substrate-binding protein n=1 Tax=Methylocystis sp. JR02 TaxID=3046284 RepID=UPI0024B8C6EA|nr:ABC transporter substrate-binding protein [Methylocystis sp. JR02]MDJ0448967.1 ABC transporter substrate-binding protein [Methylocystis sp. JR02]
MKRLAFLAAAVLFAAPAQAEKLRLALQKTGTTGWEMAVVKGFGLDKAVGLELEVTELASPEAGKIAIQGGSADLIVSDWLWVARERAQGAKLTLYPYSTGVGAVMTRDASIKSVKDLVGKKLGVAGGPLDKSWLMLEAFALKQGVDLAKSATILYGAPPLIAEKAVQGEIDAALEFWNFAADLEGKGFARAIDIVDVEKALGAKGNVVITGYVFDDAFAARNKDVLARFFTMAGKAKTLLATDDKAWAAAASRIGQKDAATLDIYRKRYVAGIPKRSIAEEEKDAAALYKVLAETGGEKLVGPGKTLAPGTFYKGGEAAAR